MYEQKTGLLLFFILIIGTILQGIGLFTSCWRGYSYGVSNYHTMEKGLWWQKLCISGNCTSTTFHDLYQAASKEDHGPSPGVTYAEQVGKQTIGVLSLFCCLVSSVFTFLIYRNHSRKERMLLLVTCLLLVAGSLIWTIIGETIATTAAFARATNDFNVVIFFPYSLFLSAFGSVLSICVVLVNFCTAWRDKQSSQSHYNPYLRPYAEYPLQMNLDKNRPQQPVVARQHGGAYTGPYSQYPMQMNEDQNRPQQLTRQHGCACSGPHTESPMQTNEAQNRPQQSARQHGGEYSRPCNEYPRQMNEAQNRPQQSARQYGGGYSWPYY